MRFFSSLKPEYKDKQFYLVQSADASESKEGALLTGSELCIDAFFKENRELLEISALLEVYLTMLPHMIPTLLDIHLRWLQFRKNYSTRVLQRRILKEWRLRRWTSASAVLRRFESFMYDTSHGYVAAMSWLYHQCWQKILSFETACFWFGIDRKCSKNLWNQSQVYCWCIDACLAHGHSTGDSNSALDALSRGCCTSKRKLFQGDWSGGPWRLTSLDLRIIGAL